MVSEPRRQCWRYCRAALRLCQCARSPLSSIAGSGPPGTLLCPTPSSATPSWLAYSLQDPRRDHQVAVMAIVVIARPRSVVERLADNQRPPRAAVGFSGLLGRTRPLLDRPLEPPKFSQDPGSIVSRPSSPGDEFEDDGLRGVDSAMQLLGTRCLRV